MTTAAQLQTTLRSIDHKSYPAYKSLRGVYQFDSYLLSIDHVQGDPFAAPSQVHVEIAHKDAKIPSRYYEQTAAKIALCDYLTRQFAAQIRQYTFRAKGSGKSGLIQTSQCGQEVLPRTACEITKSGITARFFIGFPASGRTIQAKELEKILFDFLPSCIKKVFFYDRQDKAAMEQAVFLFEDQEALRKQLSARGLAAFVADGSVLPRESGISSKPMKNSVPFVSPDTLRTTLTLPHKGTISGMGIPKGITLIVGGGYHGKSTLLQALELGVYNHIAGDGREYVITDDTALKLRSEDGRFIKDVDISLFINHLPNKKDTHRFQTEDASGSTSQAAGIIEGMEAKSRLFLLDEDTSATNFMVRDAFMQRVISRDKEPITPFLDCARNLYEKAGISTILVAGSSGAFFHIADTILQMDNYKPVDITQQARRLCQEYPLAQTEPAPFALPSGKRIMTCQERTSTRRSYRGNQEITERLKTKINGTDSFFIGHQEVNLRYIEQLIDSEQTAALALLLKYAIEKLIDGRRTIPEIADFLESHLEKEGLAYFCDASFLSCGYAIPRIQEIYSVLNRYRRP